MTTTLTVWKRRPLESICDTIDYGHTAAANDSPTGPRYLRITDIQNGSVDWSSVPFCPATRGEIERYRLQAGDIVFARTGNTTGKSFLIRDCPDDVVFASYLIRVRPTKKVDPRYLGHFFTTPDYWAQIKKSAQGAGQPGVNATKLKQLEIPIPPLTEQERIADILDKADSIRRKRQEALVTFSSLFQSAFMEFFGNPMTNPLGWHCETLGTVVATDRHGLKRGPFGGALKKEIFVPSGFKVYEQKHAIANDFTIGSYYVDKSKFLEMEAFAVQPGDLIVSCSGTMGRVAIVPDDAEPGIINQALLRITPDTSKVSSEYLKLLLETEHVQRHLYGFSRGSGLKNFPPMSDVRALPVPVPSADKLGAFHRYLIQLKVLEKRLHNLLIEAEDLFCSLMQQAFRGDL